MNFDYLCFVKELSTCFSQIGAMLPSSPYLGKDMVKPIRDMRKQKNELTILEAGPGTGPFTRQILKLMGPKDKFFICEINPRFVARLKERLAKNPHYQRHKDRVIFVQGPVQDLPKLYPEVKFDVIVSSLPFTNFTPQMVEEILHLYENILQEGGSFTVVEYVGLRFASALFSSSRRRERVRGVEHVIKGWVQHVKRNGEVKSTISMLNLPPAEVLQFDYH